MMRARRLGLVGCVSEKRTTAAPAEDLYTSTLFRGRRAFAGRTCDDWYILSAKHGLVARSTVLEPYDLALTSKGRKDKRVWATAVLAELDDRLGSLVDITFEIHAGADYFAFGLVEGLERRGATVVIPTQGLRVGEQLRFYTEHKDPPR